MSYAALPDLEAYFTNRGIDGSIYSDQQKNASLYIATNDYIDIKYEFAGLPLDVAQVNQLPTDLVSVNAKVVQATCEAAYLNLQNKLFNSAVDPLGAVKSKEVSKELDVLKKSESVEYFNSGSQQYLVSHPQIDALLAPYLATSGGFTLDYKV